MASTNDKNNCCDFIALQYAFAAHIRDPEKNPRLKDIEPRRMKIYNDLFYNNVEDFIANTYPVLRQILSNQHWHALIRDYFANHRAHTPLFPEMPREFLKYLQYERQAHPDDPPFLQELAHYEWIELAISTLDTEIDAKQFDSEGDMLKGIPVISPLAWTLNYRFPVHQISVDFQPQKPNENPIHIIVFCDGDFNVRFMEINHVTARLMALLTNNTDKTGEELLQQIITELHHSNSDEAMQGGIEILNNLKRRQIILGIQRHQ